ncbi:autoinducer binding domain-containing protein [Ideonella sp. DXS22W]|uniref:Autoinducer binding domain-containing protein n=1 Tax=Pseudaquabacterium inlustre TaxID=2984192 RepID=A0ABU9CLC3_9BURK
MRPEIVGLARAGSSAELEQALARLAGALGFDAAVAVIEDWRSFGAPVRHMVASTGQTWVLTYRQHRLHETSPIVRHCRQSTEPLVWTAERLWDEAPEYWRAATCAGFWEGLSVASHRPMSLCLVSLVRGRGAFCQAEVLPDVPDEYGLLAELLHDRLLRIVRDECLSTRLGQVSRRELECLHWTARGKTSGETGQLLNVSEATVNFHLQRAMTKLEATNRQKAVAVATALGLFTPAATGGPGGLTEAGTD